MEHPELPIGEDADCGWALPNFKDALPCQNWQLALNKKLNYYLA